MTATISKIVPAIPIAGFISRQHKWVLGMNVNLPGSEFPDGYARTLKECIHCRSIKVTVHDGNGGAWREWRTKGGNVYTGDLTPPCLPMEEVAR